MHPHVRSISRWLCLLGSLGISLAISRTAGAEQVDNPRYHCWAKFKPGSTSTLAGTMTGPQGMQMDMEMTHTLIDVKPETVTVESKVNVNVGGQVRTPPPRQQTIPAKIEKQDVKEAGEQELIKAFRHRRRG